MAGEWPSSWKRARLGDVADVTWGDTSTTKAAYVPAGHTAYSASGPDGFLPYADFDRTGVVLSAIGADCGKTWLACGKWSCIKNTIRFWATDAAVDSAFLYWLTCDPAIWPKRGSAQPFISQGDARALEIAYPELDEQRAIARILGTLDDKIELNRRMNETLEAIAQAIFKSWFVDATEDGLPQGWRSAPFASTVDILGGGTPKTSVPEYWNGDIPWFSVTDAPRHSDVFVIDTEKKITQAGIENSATKVLPEGTTIISARGTVGRVALVGVPMAMNQSCYGLRGKVGGRGYFTYYATRALVATLQQRAHGSVFDTITRDTLMGVEVIVPPPPTMEAFEQKVGPLLDYIRSNLFESRTLAALRDTLLPKLLSGEVRLTKANKMVEARR